MLLFTLHSRELAGSHPGELTVLLLTVTASLMWMSNAVNLLMIYLALETVSIASYVMVGYLKGDRLSNEASLKYVLFGAVSTGTMLFGMSLLYGLAGTLDLYGIRSALANQEMLARIRPGAHGHHSHGPRGNRVQDGDRAVPFLVPGRLYRSSDPGDGVPVGGAESSGIRGAGALLLWRSGAAVGRALPGPWWAR